MCDLNNNTKTYKTKLARVYDSKQIDVVGGLVCFLFRINPAYE